MHRAPSRIGPVFSVSTDLEATRKIDAGVALSNAFNYISEHKEPYEGFAFIRGMYSRGEDSVDVSLKDDREVFLDNYCADIKPSDVCGEDS